MAERWIKGGIWVIFAAMGLLASTQAGRAEKPRATGKLIISDVIIQNNVRITTAEIKRRLRTRIGQEYNSDLIDEDVRELYKTKQFRNIATYRQVDGADHVKVYFTLNEMPNLVQKVTFNGAKHLKTEELQNTITGVKAGIPLNPQLNLHGCQRILDKYAEMGRMFATCKLVKGGSRADSEVVYEITEGPVIKVREKDFIGNTFVTSHRLYPRLKSFWYPYCDGTYNKELADADISALCDYYRFFGFLDVRVSLETVRSEDDGQAKLIFHIQEGKRYKVGDEKGTKDDDKSMKDWVSYYDNISYSVPDKSKEHQPACIGQIRIAGNEHISSDSILAHVPLWPGKTLDYCELHQAEKTLAELGLFVVDDTAGVRPTITVIDAENGSAYKDLLITVQEKPKAKSKHRHPR